MDTIIKFKLLPDLMVFDDDTGEAIASYPLAREHSLNMSFMAGMDKKQVIEDIQHLVRLLDTVNYACEEIPEILHPSILHHGPSLKKHMAPTPVKKALEDIFLLKEDLVGGFETYLRGKKRKWPYGGPLRRAKRETLEKALIDFPGCSRAC